MSTPLQPIVNEILAGRAPPSPPASPVLTRNDENRAPEPSPATIEPPKKRRKVDLESINTNTDEEVWSMADEEITDALRTRWSSEVYDHFTVSLVRDSSTTPRAIKIVLTSIQNWFESYRAVQLSPATGYQRFTVDVLLLERRLNT
ncbi:hypothetical protein R3P38DRAFT_3235214 [Favolaschia claudopus]|uniref:Uncharacterized protein n=1 Tax=Favolaschia claudopus TaxID=2862362 RepID=A0AAV9ZFR3_9AGAR